MEKIIQISLLAALLSMGVSTTNPSPALASESVDGWKFVVAPYVWAMSIDGDVTLGNRTADFSIDFYDDILSDLDFAALGHLEVHKGR